MSYYRTPEHCKLRGELICRWEPWKKSTGPRSAEGKERVSKNGDKGGERRLLGELHRVLREQRKARCLLTIPAMTNENSNSTEGAA